MDFDDSDDDEDDVDRMALAEDLLGRALRRESNDDVADPDDLDLVADADGRVRRSGQGPRRERQKLTELKTLVAGLRSNTVSTDTLKTWVQNVSRALQQCANQSQVFSQKHPHHKTYWENTMQGYQRADGGLALVLEGAQQADEDALRHGLAAFEAAVQDLEELATD